MSKKRQWLLVGFGAGFVVGAVVGIVWTNVQLLAAFGR
jgi:hypothetical protein